MIKQDISKELAKRVSLTPAQAVHAVDGVIDIIREALLREEPVHLRGFATIKVVESPAKIARNIKKNKAIKLPKTKRVKFAVSEKLKENIKMI